MSIFSRWEPVVSDEAEEEEEEQATEEDEEKEIDHLMKYGSLFI